MLYPESRKRSLTPEVFRHPGSEYRAAPFWAWNCRLEKAELLRQLDVLKKMGMGGAHMHVRTGMATPYLSDAYMALIKACTDHCRERGMLAWLYDEDRWPSGAAGGIVTKDDKYRARHLLFTPRPYSGEGDLVSDDMTGGAGRSNRGRLLACYDVQLDADGCLLRAPRISPDDAAVGKKWYAYVEINPANPWFNGSTYVNTLDKEAMQRFIDVTYERYQAVVGDEFGGVIPAIFTDEPQFALMNFLGYAREERDVIMPWSEDVPDTFRADCQEELLDHLPELIWELPQGQISVVRYHYMDHMAERFANAFADQCGKWCGEHGLMLTGHLMSEQDLLSQTAAVGEAMRQYRSFQLPGIDMLCGNFEYTTAKQAQSAVHQYGREGMVSELYGVTGWAFDFRGHKLHGDWQAALGVTVRVPHLSWVSMKGEAKRDYPASINYQSPWWQDYALVEDHFARVNAAMTRGKPWVRVGVIHPLESYWLHWGPLEQTHGDRQRLEQRFDQVTRWLLQGSIDFDYISEALLPAQCETASAPLRVGEMAYDTIVVPGCETLRSTTLERLERFHAAGGQLIFLGEAPLLADARPSARGKALHAAACCIPFDQEALLDALRDVRMIDIRDAGGARTANLLHQLRRDGEAWWLFIAHGERPYSKDIPRRQDVRISMKGEHAVEVYDTQTGEIHPACYAHSGGKTIVQAGLWDDDSLLLRFSQDASVRPAAAEAPVRVLRRLNVPELVSYALEEPNALLLDKAEYALDDGAWRPAEELLRADNALRAHLGWPPRQGSVCQPWAVEEEAVTHHAHMRFTIHADCAVTGGRLALEDAEQAVICLNGVPVTARPEGWFVDKCIGTVPLPPLRAGENVLEVTLPFGLRDGLEWCYLLGDFSVRMQGARRTIAPRDEVLGFDDITRQGLPHYTGNLTYRIPLDVPGGTYRITVPHYAGAAVRAAVDGEFAGHVVYPPYQLTIHLPRGAKELALTVLGNRENAFGALHSADAKQIWLGPNVWRTTGAEWTDSYRLSPLGLLSAPVIEEIK